MVDDNTPDLERTPVMYRALFAVSTILVATLLLLAASLLWQGNFSSIVVNPTQWFNSLSAETSFDLISTSAELLAAVLAIAITVVAIIVELAANRYSHRITSLFMREPINILVMCFFVVATIYSVWIAVTLEAEADSSLSSNAGLLISLVMTTTSLVILLPYFAYVMSFLSPLNVINKIKRTALQAIENIDVNHIDESKAQVLTAVDELQDIARRASELSDRAVSMASINALLQLEHEYQPIAESISKSCPQWFELDDSIINDPDFVSINETFLKKIQEERIWVEVKILRQYLDFISDSNPTTRDTSYLIAINTKKIAIDSIVKRPNLELIQLCMQCFNSYLRATINNSDARTGYYIMNQYRMLAEELIRKNRFNAVSEIALHFQFYGLLGFKQNLPFLLEVAAEDIAQLATVCIGKDTSPLDDLIALLLDLDQEVKSEFQNDSLLGVRRAQLKLAAELLAAGERKRATRICEDLGGEKPERLDSVYKLLKNEDRSEYWEFTDRGNNFAYLEPQVNSQLDELISLIQSSN